MRRLIDADKLKGAISASLNTGRETFPAEIMYEAVDAQPTAYDVDKVVAELEKMADKANDNIMVSEQPQYHDGYEDGVLAAIQIVKGGGIDGD